MTYVLLGGSKDRKSNNDDKHEHGQEKRIPSTYAEGIKNTWLWHERTHRTLGTSPRVRLLGPRQHKRECYYDIFPGQILFSDVFPCILANINSIVPMWLFFAFSTLRHALRKVSLTLGPHIYKLRSCVYKEQHRVEPNNDKTRYWTIKYETLDLENTLCTLMDSQNINLYLVLTCQN